MGLTKTTVGVANISSLSSTPNSTEGLTAAQLQALFDKTGSDLKTYINDTLTAEIDTEFTTLNSGWLDAGETWGFSSVDDPTGIITITGDKTAKYSNGMRIRFVNGGNTIYGIVTGVTYSAPNTLLTFLHEIDPTDSLALHLMANSAITANYYSSMKAPLGFPLCSTKWRVIYTENTIVNQATPTGFTWYNVGTKLKEIPIGGWEILLNFVSQNGISSGSSANRVINTCLSTTNNSDAYGNVTAAAIVGVYVRFSGTIRETKEFASKTILYVNLMSDTNVDVIYSIGCKIAATCAYL